MDLPPCIKGCPRSTTWIKDYRQSTTLDQRLPSIYHPGSKTTVKLPTLDQRLRSIYPPWIKDCRQSTALDQRLSSIYHPGSKTVVNLPPWITDYSQSTTLDHRLQSIYHPGSQTTVNLPPGSKSVLNLPPWTKFCSRSTVLVIQVSEANEQTDRQTDRQTGRRCNHFTSLYLKLGGAEVMGGLRNFLARDRPEQHQHRSSEGKERWRRVVSDVLPSKPPSWTSG